MLDLIHLMTCISPEQLRLYVVSVYLHVSVCTCMYFLL